MPALYYRNETLFSEIYLEEITRQPEQDELLASLDVLHQFRDYADSTSLTAWRDSYVGEVLSALGFNAIVEGPHILKLCPLGSADQVVALCFVTASDESLDNTLMGRNWMEKTIRTLREHGLPWGLLTNGLQWRILHADEPTPYETYLEIDLEGILRAKAKDAYQIFHKFLKAQNFSKREDNQCQFDHFKKESRDKIDYIENELARALKQREEGGKGVLSDLCMGYVAELRRSGQGNLDDEALRKKVYHGAMLYMFRLLFLFYADARGLLSAENQAALQAVKTNSRAIHNGAISGEDEFDLWKLLEAIFVDIDQTYNGGLFSPQESEFTGFIEDTRIRSRFLAEAIYNLTTYREKNGEEKSVSYRDMSVRHLGTLYEGLLEHKLYIASEDTEVKITSDVVQFIPASQGGKLAIGHYIKVGEVYFAGDTSERKSSGSYYTPEHIVDHIVRNTVGKKLNGLREEFLRTERNNLDALSSAMDEAECTALSAMLEENAHEFIRAQVLRLSVLDPAMGSGHFLVSAANCISNFITEMLNESGITGGLESATAEWRRWVVENCIYGVDINPLAVELAKLSLWILSMAKDHPLSFLNHHLKRGNSLVGARLEEIGNYPFSTAKKEFRQLALFKRDANFHIAMEESLTKSHLITTQASISLVDVEVKKLWLSQIEQALEVYKSICDIHISLFFENPMGEERYNEFVNNRVLIPSTQSSLKTKNYFHWELEFPEIFLNANRSSFNESNGFDIVIGNPPYDVIAEGKNQDNLKKLLEYFNLNTIFKPALGRKLDLYRLFISLAKSIAKSEGLMGFIVPLSLLADQQTANLRNNLVSEDSIISIDSFPQKDDPRRRVFFEAKLATCVPIIRKGITSLKTTLRIHPENRFDAVSGEVIIDKRTLSQLIDKLGCIPQTKSDIELNLLLKLHTSKQFDTMDKLLVTYQGEFNETTHQRYLTKKTNNGPKILRGGNVQRYDFIDVAKQGEVYYVNEEEFSKSQISGKFEHIKSKRFGYQRKAALDNWKRLIFCELPQPSYCFESISYFLYEGTKSYFALALLNSNLLEWRFTATSTNNMVSTAEIAGLPIPHIHTVSSNNPSKTTAIFKNLYKNSDPSSVLTETNNYIYSDVTSIHDFLAYLAEEMISLNKERQLEIKHFLTYLQQEIGTSINDFTGKTTIQNYLGDYQKNQHQVSIDNILEVLRRNQRNIQFDIKDSAFVNKLKDKYQASLDILSVIKDRLISTDYIIDNIIYQLYGLTKEEIALVESKGQTI